MRYSFTDCVLDTERRELRRGEQVVPLRPKVFQVLTCLIEHRDRVVTKEELFEKCWPGVVVGDASLNSCLKEIRRAIGDSGAKQKHLRTLHGHGYHFVAPVKGADAAEDVQSPQPASAKPAAEREYKQVSVLACRVRGAGALAETLGPEEMDARMRGFFSGADVVLERYGGTVTERLGDGFTALFGAPQAFEDHGRRAVLAAIEIRDIGRRDDPSLELGVGLHTGQIVVGSLDASEQLFTAAGSTTQTAQRIRDAADREILVSQALFGLVEADFESSPADWPDGVPPVVAIKRFSHLRGGVPQRDSRRRSRFVGRDDEMSIIRKRLKLAVAGTGQIVCVSGEPGIGKSRLLHELRLEISSMPVRIIDAKCLPYRQMSPYFPLVRLLRQSCGIKRDNRHDRALSRLRQHAGVAGIGEDGILQLLAVLDAADDPGAARDDAPRTDALRVFTDASRLVLQQTAKRPLVIAIEDLHWIDATTEQWLTTFVRRIAGLPVLLIVTFRPGYASVWMTHSDATQLSLPRLNDTDSAALVASLQKPAAQTNDVRRRIVRNAQGNPFFLEELAFSAAGNGTDDASAVPPTVQAVLASRIDQLAPDDKALLQLAAVIGTPVLGKLLEAVSPGVEIDAVLDRLEAGEFLYEDPTAEEHCLYFKHALTRDVA
ncbi:MAG TPA: AAA family ATPase, partial [Woeseiaceae bacterium]|nr:AAA family ATPase [Woeseiaceae bacterium]